MAYSKTFIRYPENNSHNMTVTRDVSVIQDSGLLVCDATSLGTWFPPFWRNVYNNLHDKTASHPRRPKSSIIALWELRNLQSVSNKFMAVHSGHSETLYCVNAIPFNLSFTITCFLPLSIYVLRWKGGKKK